VILVTGGTGFIGSFVVKKLLDQGRSVLATKRSDSVIPDMLQYKPNLFWHNADISDYFALEDLFANVTEVYHCAGMVSFDNADRKQLMKVNVEGSMHIVNLCLLKKARLVFLSSVAALGDGKGSDLVRETSKWEWSRHKSAYSISKFEAEREVWRGMAEGLDAVIVNPTVVIGPGSRSPSGKIFSLLKKGLKYYPPGGTGIVDVEDLAEIMIRLMAKKEITETSFIVNNVNISYQDLFSRYCKLIDREPPARPGNRYLFSLAWRLQKALSVFRLGVPGLTREVVSASFRTTRYGNEKLMKTLDYTFKPIETSLRAVNHES
jgi:dihydroflavonol-4-reductase